MIRAPKILLTTDKTIWTKAFNNCNKSTIRTGVNHVWIRWYPGSTRSGYFRMGLAKDGGPGGGGKSEKILDASTFKDNIKIVVVEGEPKIQITYNRDDKPCTVTLEPCDETKRQEYKNCLTPGIGFESKKEWVESVMLWFNNKIMEQESKNKKSTTPPIAITDEQVEKIIQEQQDQDQQSLANSKKIENTELSALTQNINELSSNTEKKTEEAMAKAQQQMEEHSKLMNEAIGKEKPKIGGKKSRKKRRTKKRKSIRRKKAKKTKKH